MSFDWFSWDAACAFLWCKKEEPHRHLICTDCGSVDREDDGLPPCVSLEKLPPELRAQVVAHLLKSIVPKAQA